MDTEVIKENPNRRKIKLIILTIILLIIAAYDICIAYICYKQDEYNSCNDVQEESIVDKSEYKEYIDKYINN